VNEFRGQNARFQGFSQPYRISNKNPLPRLLQGLHCRVKLVRHLIHRALMRHLNTGIIGRLLSQQALHIKQGIGISWRRISNNFGFSRVQYLNPVFQLAQEDALMATNDLRDAIAG